LSVLIAELLDYAGKSEVGTRRRVLDRLRFCEVKACGRAFSSPKRTGRYCSGKCRRTVERPKTQCRVAKLRDKERQRILVLGLEAPPGKCRDPRLRDPTAQRSRLDRLQRDHHLTREQAMTAVAREIVQVEKMRATSGV
jgi:hypothetical protein